MAVAGGGTAAFGGGTLGERERTLGERERGNRGERVKMWAV